MQYREIIAQVFGVMGLLLSVYSFQEKNNKRFLVVQGMAGLMFFLNFFLIEAMAAALFNLTNLLRGILLANNCRKVWRLMVLELLYTGCFLFALTAIWGNPLQIFLSALTYFALMLMTVLMWLGNGAHIRYAQLAFVSPAWIVHNVFNFSLGGLLCEVFSMLSAVISLIRYRKDGFEVKE